jgi:hypothetical protein
VLGHDSTMEASGPESWGRWPQVDQQAVALAWMDDPLPAGAPVLAHGLGRSYGDSCLNASGPVLLTRGLRRFLAFDGEHGVVRAEAGLSLGELTEVVCSPERSSSPWGAPWPTTSTGKTTTGRERSAGT